MVRNSALIKLLALLLIVLFPAICNSAPASVDVDSGTLSNGESVTLSGTGFGAFVDEDTGESKLNWAWNDFETAVEDNGFSTIYDNCYTRQTTVGRSGYYLERVGTDPGPGGTDCWGSVQGLKKSTEDNPTNELYLTYYVYQIAPCEGTKTTRIKFGPFGVSPGSDTFLNFYEGDWAINYPSAEAVWGVFDPYISRGEWVRIEEYWYGDIGESNVQQVGFTGKNSNNPILDETFDRVDVLEGDRVEVSLSSSYKDSGGTAFIAFDDVYASHTIARVELCAESTWSARAHCEIQIPTAWSATSITIDFNQGTFNDGNTAYLYVVDSAGDVSSAKSITIAGETTDTTAPLVSTTVPTDEATGITVDSTVTITFNEGLTCGTVTGSTVSISPSTMDGTPNCSGSVVDFDTTGQSADTLYTVTLTTGITDDASSPIALAAEYEFSYTTLAASGSCTTNIDLCDNQTDCETEGYNWCAAETPACKVAACDATCSYANWYLCDDLSSCETAGRDWWDGACRTIPVPNWDGANQILTPDTVGMWSEGVPGSWTNPYTQGQIEENALGVRLFNVGQIIQPTTIVAGTTYDFALNVLSVDTQVKIWYYNTNIYINTVGTHSGQFTTPDNDEEITDHGFYIEAAAGNDVIVNHFVLRESLDITRAIIGTGTNVSIGTGTAVSIGN